MRLPLRGGRMSMARVRFATISMCWSHAFTAETASRRLHANLLLVARMTRARDWLAAFLRVIGHMLHGHASITTAASATFSI